MASSLLRSVPDAQADADRLPMSAASALEIEIAEISTARGRDRRRFVALPFSLAAGHDHWQPGLRRLQEDLVHPGKNPFWRDRSGSFFVALRRGRVVGRMAVVDPGGIPDRRQAAVLAFPDFVDDG